MEVPTKTSLAEIYPEDALKSQTKRWNELISTFKETYGKLPDFVSRSPGRVNIIGEVGDRVRYDLQGLDSHIKQNQSIGSNLYHSTSTIPSMK